MAYAIAIMVFLVLPAIAVASRIAAYQRYGAHGRPDLESGHTGDLRPAANVAYNNLLLQAREDASGARAGRKDRRTTLRPVFNLGGTPVPEGVSPWVSDEHIRKEFDLDSSDGHGRAA
ncbi:MAG: hypothetical protein F4Y99_10655 [Acidimicrobiaceae bacterium]|nr:hypothetical protein [Acidimicrobiaceae bacterium]MDE0515946.1 hypothetical protein [Acidimicrobiaceae bacterium]MDE0655401.1 hypothetical protein [Acidimicrobiaceae bacterium]MXZ96372.1 hypothetical protein [Acidimicrobiaceae bacterium]MYF41729.1 hypothetical protein [Acidimicrobiaceae bacterium]